MPGLRRDRLLTLLLLGAGCRPPTSTSTSAPRARRRRAPGAPARLPVRPPCRLPGPSPGPLGPAAVELGGGGDPGSKLRAPSSRTRCTTSRRSRRSWGPKTRCWPGRRRCATAWRKVAREQVSPAGHPARRAPRCARAHLGARSLQAVVARLEMPAHLLLTPGVRPGPLPFPSHLLALSPAPDVGSRFSRMRFPNRATPALLCTQPLARDLAPSRNQDTPGNPRSPLVYSLAPGQRSGEVMDPEDRFP